MGSGFSYQLAGLAHTGTIRLQMLMYGSRYTAQLIDNVAHVVIGSSNLDPMYYFDIPYSYCINGGATLQIVDNEDTGRNHNLILQYYRAPHDTSVLQAIVVNSCDDEFYHYGFNGQMKVNEWAGIGNSLEFKYRGLDTRIGRFRSVDPLTKQYPWYSPYQFAGNDVIRSKDLEGKEPIEAIIEEGQAEWEELQPEIQEGWDKLSEAAGKLWDKIG